MKEYICEEGKDIGVWTTVRRKGELIRCKDCKYSDTYTLNSDNSMPLKCLGIRYGGVYPNWYCEHAERKEE